MRISVYPPVFKLVHADASPEREQSHDGAENVVY